MNDLASAVKVGTAQSSYLPLILSLVGFFYLWWLAALLFELAFIWHRYIRGAVANQRLFEWKKEVWSAPKKEAAKV